MDRSTQVKLTRLRIGHTLVTHAHLMTMPRTGPAECSNCNVELTVKHMLQDCPHVMAERTRTIGRNTIKDILGPQTRIASLMKYLKSIKI